ncbi:hypothetical protein [Flavobacterium oreochromis]|uniref:hypothetical protein n=1 Tax=Flavobacterium oreochromis TaxID=2906078 RepID=UPI0038582792
MGNQLNKLKLLVKTIALLVLSSSIAQNKLSEIELGQNKSKINFFDKKYFDGYNLSIDESNISDHPLFSYLNCEKEGYFTVHFVPKSSSIRRFWKNEYHNKYKYEYDDLVTENKIISELLKNKLEKYTIFSFHIKKHYLNTKDGCTIESVFLKDNSIADLYLYDQKLKKWIFLKKVKNKILPPYAGSNFFINNFVKYF